MTAKDPRIIEAIKADMPVGFQMLARFEKGDTVAHIYLGDGVVTDKDPVSVTVTFERRDKQKKNVVGIYDAHWFDLHPRYLFHRGTITPVNS